MDNSENFYKKQLSEHTSKVSQLKKRLLALSTIRLIIFSTTIFGIYLSYSYWQVAVVIAIIGIGLFLYVLSIYTDCKIERDLNKRLVKINEEELEIAKGIFKERPQGLEFQNPNHYYSLDIDLFGKGSFFQFINRTTIKEGTERLVDYLLSNNTKGIKERQEATMELASHPKWYQKYAAIAQGVEVEYSAKDVISWLKNHKPFLNKQLLLVTSLFSVASVIIVGLAVTQLIPIDWLGYWLLIGLGITGLYLKKINLLANNTSKVKDTFRQYALLLKHIEDVEFSSELLKHQQQKIKSNTVKASQLFSKFSKALDALDNRNNLLSAILGNGYFLWDIRQSYYIERWIQDNNHKVEDWFEVVTFFDAYNSLGNYAFNHADYVYPEIISSSETIQASGLGHALLEKSKRVNSDLEINTKEFFITTGANMAGKSTFLRTVGLHIVMANVGLPVCAASSRYKPIKLVTSMRTTDSLDDDSSYFFSELTRLKFIVDQLENDTYFIILDEILKGTNSTDKAIGSKKFVEKLVNLNATGIIATHDLSLTEIESELEPVKNYYFDAQIIDDELHFDYKLKKGVCQNMNASFLLKKMDIV
ncbi:MutS-related protein [Winogradskyella sp. A3E31]|uniref:MutS-related protein n=1 Tax=Winogradskyella sp. A3E31 TaxID=3349637 RepID=UPI00398A6C00